MTMGAITVSAAKMIASTLLPEGDADVVGVLIVCASWARKWVDCDHTE